MKKKFIVSVNFSTVQQQQSFINYLRSKNINWWHWLSNTWLIVDNNHNFDAPTLRDAVRRHFNGRNNLVIEISQEGDTWAGFGPSSDDKNMFQWLDDNWTGN